VGDPAGEDMAAATNMAAAEAATEPACRRIG
jgi:hypothetical protein